jgi:hypothetical protein
MQMPLIKWTIVALEPDTTEPLGSATPHHRNRRRLLTRATFGMMLGLVMVLLVAPLTQAAGVYDVSGRVPATVPSPPAVISYDYTWANASQTNVIFAARTVSRAPDSRQQKLWAEYRVFHWVGGSWTLYDTRTVVATIGSTSSVALSAYNIRAPIREFLSVEVIYTWGTTANTFIGAATLDHTSVDDYICAQPVCSKRALGGMGAVIVTP